MKNKSLKIPYPYRIAILNPYLQSGKTQIAEVEVAKRMELIGDQLGITIKMLARNKELYEFNPDFVIALSYQEPKLTSYPTYGTLTIPPKWVRNINRFKRNILSYDAYMTMSDNVIEFLDDLTRKAGKRMTNVYSAFSAPQMPFEKLNLDDAQAAYFGSNWDGHRHKSFFQYFKGTSYLKCYGPKKNWKTAIDANIFGGEVPFDGQALYNVYKNNGIGLAIGHPDFDSEGAPNTRMFEIPASSAVMIAGNNKLIRDIFGDSSLYVDINLPSKELFEAVKDQVEWVRCHTEKATEMARAANHIFCTKISTEIFLKNIIQHYESNFAYRSSLDAPNNISQNFEKGSNIDVILFPDKIDEQVLSLTHDLSRQRLKPRAIHFVMKEQSINTKNQFERIDELLRKVKIKRIIQQLSTITEQEKIHYIHNIAQDPYVDWLALPSTSDRYFPEHFYSCIESLRRAEANGAHRGNISALYSAIVDKSDLDHHNLQELFPDSYSVERDEHYRLGYYTQFNTENELKSIKDLHLGGIMINVKHVPTLDKTIKNIADFAIKAQQTGKFLFTCDVTCQRLVSPVGEPPLSFISHQRLY